MRKAVPWVAILIVITLVFGTVYAVVQQSLRLGANDPQVQLAEDTASSLDQGANPALVLGTNVVNADKSLAPFIAIYDKTGTLVATNGSVAGGAPHVPVGVLRAASGRSYHAVTWQPGSKVRLAAVSVAAHKYYVLSARSLKEVENRESIVFNIAALGWLASVIVLGFSYWLTSKR